MQTFLPYVDFAKSANCLDDKRLGIQRIEAKQIYLAITDPSYGWQNHPAVKMWRHWPTSLATYGEFICLEWRDRGFNDSLQPWFAERSSINMLTQPTPSWLTPEFCRAHQSNLLRKDYAWYSQFNWDVPTDLPYIWPVK